MTTQWESVTHELWDVHRSWDKAQNTHEMSAYDSHPGFWDSKGIYEDENSIVIIFVIYLVNYENLKEG